MKTDDPIFTELAMRAIAGKATVEQQAQLKDLLKQPELAAEFKELQADAGFASEVLPMLGEEPVKVPPLTDFERSQMRKMAEQREQRLARESKKPESWSWRWILGLASAAAVIMILVVMNQLAPTRTIQLAMLDSIGSSRGTNDINATLIPALKDSFGQTNIISYTDSAALNAWLKDWPDAKTVKIVYDRDAGEVRVVYPPGNNQIMTKTFPVLKEADLPAVLKKAAESIK